MFLARSVTSKHPSRDTMQHLGGKSGGFKTVQWDASPGKISSIVRLFLARWENGEEGEICMRSYREVCDMRVKARKSRRGEQQDTKNGLYSKKMKDTRLQPVQNCKSRKIGPKRNEEKAEKRK